MRVIILLLTLLFLYSVVSASNELLWNKCAFVQNNTIYQPTLLHYYPYVYEKCSSHEEANICIAKKKSLCPSKKEKYYPSQDAFVSAQGWPTRFDYINESILRESQIIFPFYFWIDGNITKEYFFKMRTRTDSFTAVPIPNVKTDFQYVENLSQCQSKFCLVPEYPIYVISRNNTLHGNIVEYGNHWFRFNDSRCAQLFWQYLNSGDFVALALKKVDIALNGSCSAIGHGNFFSFIIDAKHYRTKTVCRIVDRQLECNALNPLTGKIEQNQIVGDTGFLYYNFGDKKFHLAVSPRELFKDSNPKMLYFDGVAYYFSPVMGKSVRLNYIDPQTLSLSKLTFKDSMSFDTLTVIPFDYQSKALTQNIVPQKVRDVGYIEDAIDSSALRCYTADYITFYCGNKTLHLSQLLGKFSVRNGTIYLWFNRGVLVNGNDYSTIPITIHVGDVVYNCSVEYILRGSTENRMNIVRSLQCHFKPDPLLKELFHVLEKYNRDKTIEKEIKIVKNGSIVKYIFPLVTKIESVFPYQWNPAKYKEVTIEHRPASVLLMSIAVIASIVIVALYVGKKKRKREQDKANK